MEKKQARLGRGLDSLIPAVTRETGPFRQVPVEKIRPSPFQPRQNFPNESLEGLAATIRESGLIQPLKVRERDGFYELIAGERRFRAVQKYLGWKKIPVLVSEASDSEVRKLALVENLQREDLNPIETAAAFQELLQDTGSTHEELARGLGVSRVHFTNTLRLLELPEEVRQMVAGGELPPGSARALLQADNQLTRLRLAQRAVKEGLTTRQVEQLAGDNGRRKRSGKAGRKVTVPSPAVHDLEERLVKYLGTKVRVEDKQGRGRIILEYYSVEDAQRLLERLGLPAE
jgi:ParB family chromosome partitioning protein